MGCMSAKQQKPAAPKPLFTCATMCAYCMCVGICEADTHPAECIAIASRNGAVCLLGTMCVTYDAWWLGVLHCLEHLLCLTWVAQRF